MDNSQKILSQMTLPPAPNATVYYQDLASDFIEQVVGRQRWRENLAAMIREKTLKPNLERWLQTMGIRAKPAMILQAISVILKRKSTVWR